MQINRKISRRRFLQTGLGWGLLIGLWPLRSLVREERDRSGVRPVTARHWNRLAG